MALNLFSTQDINDINSVSGVLGPINGGTGATTFTQGSVIFAGASSVLSQDNPNLFWDSTNHRMGIGTTVPDVSLTISGNTAIFPAPPGAVSGLVHIVGGDAQTNKIVMDSFGSPNNLIFRRSDGTAAAPTNIKINDIIGTISCFGYGASSYGSNNRSLLSSTAAENWSDTAQGTMWQFSTTLAGTITTSIKMTFDSSGKLGIGTLAPTSLLDVNGGAAIGSYAGVNAAPSNGLIVSGRVGIANNNPSYPLQVGGDIATTTAGQGFRVAEGSNARMGTSVLSTGSVVVANTSITATTRVFLTNNASSGTVGSPYISSRTAGASFQISSTNALDSSTIAWLLLEPA